MLTAEAEGGQIKAHNYWSDKTYGAVRLNFLSEHRASLDADAISRHRNRSATNTRKSFTAEGAATEPDVSEQQRASYFGKSTASSSTNLSTDAPADKPYVTVRRFMLAHEHFPFQRMREVTQLQYSNWPDFGAPAHPAHLLGLVEQCDAVVRSLSSKQAAAARHESDHPVGAFTRPVLVHCSAGCGRTGTFCTVDSVVDMLKRQRQARATAGLTLKTLSQQQQQQHVSHSSAPKQFNFGADSSGDDDDNTADDNDDDGEGAFRGLVKHRGTKDNFDWLLRDDVDLIEATVEEFRLQRLSMVQSLRQFVLCYESALEWIAAQSHGGAA